MKWHVAYRMSRLQDEDLALLKSVRNVAERIAEPMTREFYLRLEDQPQLMDLIRKHSSIERLKKTLQHYFLQMFEGRITDEYCASRERIGQVHHRIGLGPQWFITMSQVFCEHLVPGAVEEWSAEIDQEASHRHAEEIARLKEYAAHRVGLFQKAPPPPEPAPFESKAAQSVLKRLAALESALTKMLTFDQHIALAQYMTAYDKDVTDRQAEVERAFTRLKETGRMLSEVSNNLAHGMQSATAGLEQLAAGASHQANEATVLQADMDTSLAQSSEGGEMVQSTAEAANRIARQAEELNFRAKKSAENISEIEKFTRMILDIAEQTNLLALNAAIEAARAGQQGRGFAVVADEVRKLATKARESADMIAALASRCSADGRIVVEVADQALQAAEQVRLEAERTLQKFRQIGDTTTRTADSIRSFSMHATNTAAAVEELTAASEEVLTQANHLQDLSKGLVKSN